MTIERIRSVARIVLALAYLVAGVAHIVRPSGFVAITPDWVPAPETVVQLTGWCEIAGALALLFVPRLHRAAGVAFAAYAVCVFPANINHAINSIAIGGLVLGWAYHVPRLLFQPVIVWWSLWSTRVIEWPFYRRCG